MRPWLRLLPKRIYHDLPASGYGLAWGAAGLAFLGLWYGLWRCSWPGFRSFEVTFFLILPALFALFHVLAPRANWGGKPYWVLAGVWLGAALLGALAHWPALDPLTPWFSLARYVLIALAVVLSVVSQLFARQLFATEVVPNWQHRGLRVVNAIKLALVVIALATVFALVPYRLVLAPRDPGIKVRRLFTDTKSLAVSRVLWSPDSQTFLASVEALGPRRQWQVWRFSLDGPHTVVAKGAFLSRQPWLSDGKGFLFSRHGRDDGPREIWYASADGRQQRRLLQGDKIGTPACSPTDARVAFRRDGWAYTANPDLTSPRRVAPCDFLFAWSPDGRSLLLCQSRPGSTGRRSERIHWWSVVSADGGAPRPLPKECVDPYPVWLNGRELVAKHHDAGWASDWLLEATDTTTLGVWSPEGELRRAYRYRTGFDLSLAWDVAPAPDGKRVAVPLGSGLPLRERVFIIDMQTGRPRSLGIGPAYNLAWSPDGKKLAFQGTEFHVAGSEASDTTTTTYLGLLTGL